MHGGLAVVAGYATNTQWHGGLAVVTGYAAYTQLAGHQGTDTMDTINGTIAPTCNVENSFTLRFATSVCLALH